MAIDILSIECLWLCDGQQARPAARYARHADPEDARPSATARLRCRALHQASIRRCADGRRRLALSSAPTLTTAGLGEGGMEDDGDKTESPFLHADRRGAQAVGHRVVAV